MSERPPEAPPGDQAPPPPPLPIEPRPAAAAPGPAPGMVRRLTRRANNKVLAGVAGGIADYLGIEAWIVRIGFVILVPFGGFGALAYLIAWLLVPVEGSQQSLAGDVLHRPPSGWRGYLGVALILLAVALLASAFSEPGVIWAIVLIAFGIFLFRQDDPPEPPDRRPPPAGGGPDPATTAATTPLPAPPSATTTAPLGTPPDPDRDTMTLPPDVPAWEPPPPPPDRAAAWGAPPP
ncbi:MAG: PspC domain-containing protein, partial [Actinomycetota bacterium]